MMNWFIEVGLSFVNVKRFFRFECNVVINRANCILIANYFLTIYLLIP